MRFRSAKTLEIKFNAFIVEMEGLSGEGLDDLSEVTLVTSERQNEVLGLLDTKAILCI